MAEAEGRADDGFSSERMREVVGGCEKKSEKR
jgi:hypothetical protein